MFGRPSFDVGSRNINNFDKFPSNNAMNMNMNMSQNMMNNYSVNNINNFNQMQNPMMNTMMNMNNQFLGNNMYNTNINNMNNFNFNMYNNFNNQNTSNFLNRTNSMTSLISNLMNNNNFNNMNNNQMMNNNTIMNNNTNIMANTFKDIQLNNNHGMNQMQSNNYNNINNSMINIEPMYSMNQSMNNMNNMSNANINNVNFNNNMMLNSVNIPMNNFNFINQNNTNFINNYFNNNASALSSSFNNITNSILMDEFNLSNSENMEAMSNTCKVDFNEIKMNFTFIKGENFDVSGKIHEKFSQVIDRFKNNQCPEIYQEKTLHYLMQGKKIDLEKTLEELEVKNGEKVLIIPEDDEKNKDETKDNSNNINNNNLQKGILPQNGIIVKEHNHNLVYSLNNFTWKCNLCRKKYEKKYAKYYCSLCNFSMCEACHDNKNYPKKKEFPYDAFDSNIEIKKKFMKTAYHKHILVYSRTSRDSEELKQWACDNCKSIFENDVWSFYCTKCDFDICAKCAGFT